MTRIEREKNVVGLMIGLYCHRHHVAEGRECCEECADLLEYACSRLERCPKGNIKSSCRKCEIHCYSPSRREQIRNVMRYAGPRMIFVHPVAAVRHLVSELRADKRRAT